MTDRIYVSTHTEDPELARVELAMREVAKFIPPSLHQFIDMTGRPLDDGQVRICTIVHAIDKVRLCVAGIDMSIEVGDELTSVAQSIARTIIKTADELGLRAPSRSNGYARRPDRWQGWPRIHVRRDGSQVVERMCKRCGEWTDNEAHVCAVATA